MILAGELQFYQLGWTLTEKDSVLDGIRTQILPGRCY